MGVRAVFFACAVLAWVLAASGHLFLRAKADSRRGAAKAEAAGGA